MPFDDESQKPANSKVGVKINNNQSMFAGNVKRPSREEFEKKAAQVNDKMNEYQERAVQLSLNYKKLLDDKTLLQNKNVFQQDAEKEVISNLMQLAIDMNTDPNEEEGMGSVGLISLLCRCLLIQRDKINELSYGLSQADKKFVEMDKQLKTVQAEIDSSKKSE